MSQDVCPKTGKVRFGSSSAAHKAVHHGAKGYRAYRCKSCRGWHTTSKPFVPRKVRGVMLALGRISSERGGSE